MLPLQHLIMQTRPAKHLFYSRYLSLFLHVFISCSHFNPKMVSNLSTLLTISHSRTSLEKDLDIPSSSRKNKNKNPVTVRIKLFLLKLTLKSQWMINTKVFIAVQYTFTVRCSTHVLTQGRRLKELRPPGPASTAEGRGVRRISSGPFYALTQNGHHPTSADSPLARTSHRSC